MKNLMIGFLITAAMVLGVVLSVESGRLDTAMNQIEAHKLAMVYANNAIHTFADPVFAKN